MQVECACIERGDLPQTAAEFAACRPVVVLHQALAREPDKAVLQRLAERMSERIDRTGEGEAHVAATFGRGYVEARAQAILLRSWQTVPLLLDRPLIAIMSPPVWPTNGVHHDAVIAVREPNGKLVMHPDRRTLFSQIRDSAETAENLTLFIRDVLDMRLETVQELARYAEALWRAARKYHSYWWRHLTEEVDRAD